MTDEGIAANVETMQSVDIDVDETLFTNELLEEALIVRDPGDDPWASVTTSTGLPADEVISTLQKSIRRGEVRNAVLCALDLSATSPELDTLPLGPAPRHRRRGRRLREPVGSRCDRRPR